MMNFLRISIIFASIALIYSLQTKTIEEHFKDFDRLMNSPEVRQKKGLLMKKYEQELENLKMYLSTDEFKNLSEKVENTSEFKNTLKYLEDSSKLSDKTYNLKNTSEYISYISDLDLKNTSDSNLIGFVNEFKALLPHEERKKMYEEKMQNSPEFRNFVSRFFSDEAQEVFLKLLNTPEVKSYIYSLNENGVPVKELAESTLEDNSLLLYILYKI